MGIHSDKIMDRILIETRYIIANQATIRETAKKAGVSKSTTYIDLTRRLPSMYPVLGDEVRSILDKNMSERHIRGGEATRIKFSKK